MSEKKTKLGYQPENKGYQPKENPPAHRPATDGYQPTTNEGNNPSNNPSPPKEE